MATSSPTPSVTPLEVAEYYQQVSKILERHDIDTRFLRVDVDNVRKAPRLPDGSIDYEKIEEYTEDNLTHIKTIFSDIAADFDSGQDTELMPKPLLEKLKTGFSSKEDYDKWQARYPNFLLSTDNSDHGDSEGIGLDVSSLSPDGQ